MAAVSDPASPKALTDSAGAHRRDTTPEHDLARRFGTGFFALAGLTYCLIVLGALVRAHGAGLSCPDWPLCFGELIPAFNFKIAFEWGHRALAGTIGLLFAGLSAAVLRRPPMRTPMLTALLIAATLLTVQIILGGLTVLELLASWTVTSHLVTGNAFALALLLVGRRLRRLARPASGPADPLPSHLASNSQLRFFVAVVGGLLAVQIILGGLVSSNYAGLACPDWPTCMNGQYVPTLAGIQGIHVLHRLCAYALALLIPLTAWIARVHPGARRPLQLAAALVAAQVIVGISNVLLRIPVEVTALHSALAAGLIATVGISVAEVFRRRTPQLVIN